MIKFAIKKVFKPKKYKKNIQKAVVAIATTTPIQSKEVIDEVIKPNEEIKVVETIIEDKKVSDMDTKEKITYANAILANQEEAKVKKVKKDKGLIERTESSKIVLTEDNKELLND